jgi:hypothetical protein
MSECNCIAAHTEECQDRRVSEVEAERDQHWWVISTHAKDRVGYFDHVAVCGICIYYREVMEKQERLKGITFDSDMCGDSSEADAGLIALAPEMAEAILDPDNPLNPIRMRILAERLRAIRNEAEDD